MSTVTQLKDFIDYAERNRKYAVETAKGRRAALKLFEDELTEDEKESIDLIEERLDRIYQSVHAKQKMNISASSLETYKSRVKALIKEYKRYGSDPTAFNAWDMTRKREPKSQAKSVVNAKSDKAASAPLYDEVLPVHSAVQMDTQYVSFEPAVPFGAELNEVKFYLRPDFRVTLALPMDLSSNEAARISRLIEGMVMDREQGGI